MITRPHLLVPNDTTPNKYMGLFSRLLVIRGPPESPLQESFPVWYIVVKYDHSLTQTHLRAGNDGTKDSFLLTSFASSAQMFASTNVPENPVIGLALADWNQGNLEFLKDIFKRARVFDFSPVAGIIICSAPSSHQVFRAPGQPDVGVPGHADWEHGVVWVLVNRDGQPGKPDQGYVVTVSSHL